MSTFAPLGDLAKVMDEKEDADEIRAIEKVIKLILLYENPKDNGVYVHWQYNLIRKDYTQKEYISYLKAFSKICLKYPDTFLKNRVKYFIQTMGITKEQSTLTRQACFLYEDHNVASDIGTSKINQPINSELRKSVIRFLV